MTRYLHVVVTLRDDPSKRRFLFGDLDTTGLLRQFLTPYRRGEKIVVGNDLIPLSEVTTVNIIKTKEPKERALKRLQRESNRAIDEFNAQDSGAVIVSMGAGWRDTDIVAAGTDVTDRYITAGPGAGTTLANWASNPWVIGIGTALIVTAILALLAKLFS